MSNMVSTRTGFGTGMIDLAESRDDVLLASADTFRSFALGQFVERYPEKYFEYGIAEQNMITASAAMASEGYKVFCVGYSPFLSMRAVEQIRTFVAYPNLDVKIVAGLAGLSGDTDGVTHQGTEDISMIRAIPNMKLICPADAVAARAFTKIAAEQDGPVYLRLGRGPTPIIYDEDMTFEFGKAILYRNYGYDAVVVATGVCVGEAGIAADMLKEKGINATVIDMHTIKPIDAETIINECSKTTTVITVEDGSIHGGLGGAVSEILLENGAAPKKFKRMGMDSFGTTGKLPDLLSLFKIDSGSIANTAEELLK